MKEIRFYYLSKPVYAFAFCFLFILVLGILIFIAHKITELNIIEINISKESGFYYIFVFLCSIPAMACLYFFAAKPAYFMSSKKATANLYDDYFTLSYGNRNIRISYSDLNEIKVKNRNFGWFARSQQATAIILYQNSCILTFSTAYKEVNPWDYPYDIEHYSLIKFIRILEKRADLPHSNRDAAISLIEQANRSWGKRKKDYAKAESLYRQALEEQPDNPEALTMYAEMLFMTGRDSEAEALYEQACEIDSSFAENPANHYEALGNKEREAYWRNKMKIEVKKSNNAVFAKKSITKKEKKRYKVIATISLLDFIFVICIKLLMNNGYINFLTGVFLILAGVMPRGILAIPIVSSIEDKYDEYAKRNPNKIRDTIFFILFLIPGGGIRGTPIGLIPLLVMVTIALTPTLLGVLIANAIG